MLIAGTSHTKGKLHHCFFPLYLVGYNGEKEKRGVGISFFECFVSCRGQIQFDNKALQYTKKLLVVFYVRVTLASGVMS